MLTCRLTALTLLALSSIQTGCVLHAPMSEVAVFRGGRSAALHPNRTAVGISASRALSATDDLQRALEEERVLDRTGSVEPRNADQHGAGLYVVKIPEETAVALSGTFGLGVAGVDITAPLAGGVYVTGSAAYGGVELVVQRPVFDVPNVGLAVGLSYRLESHAYDVCRSTAGGACGGIFPNNETVALSVVGGRVMGIARQTDSGLGLYGNVTVGYAPAFGRAAVSCAVSMIGF